MTNEIIYKGYAITFTCGFYWLLDKCFNRLKDAREYIDNTEETQLIYD